MAKRMETIYQDLDRQKLYPLDEAMAMLKERCKARFDETIDLAINLGVDPRQSDQMVRGVCELPHGTGRSVKIAVFARDDKADEAKKAGADIVGAEDLAVVIEKGQIDFDRCVATPDMMPIVGRLGKILGPRGLMPNPKTGTVTLDLAKTISSIKQGAVEFRVDKGGIIHLGIGKASFSKDSLLDNMKAVMAQLMKLKPSSLKGHYLKKITLSSTMGIGIKIDPKTITSEQGS